MTYGNGDIIFISHLSVPDASCIGRVVDTETSRIKILYGARQHCHGYCEPELGNSDNKINIIFRPFFEDLNIEVKVIRRVIVYEVF